MRIWRKINRKIFKSGLILLEYERINFMTKDQFYKNLEVPSARVDAILDTDTYNEIDDQFALAYMLLKKEKNDKDNVVLT